MTSTEKTDTDAKENEEKAIKFKDMRVLQKIKHVKSLVSIEPLICIFVAAKIVAGPALTNLQIEKACKVSAGFNDTICDSIVSGTYLKKNFVAENSVVQTYMNHLHSWEVPISSIVPVILVLFLGSYSDRHKIRKPFLLMPLIGELVTPIGSCLSVIYMREWSLEVQAVIDRVIPSFFGAEKLIIMVSYAYITDVSSPKMRIIRLTVVPLLLNILIPVTQAISGILFKKIGYTPVFCLSFILLLGAIFNVVFSVKESRPKNQEDKDLIKDIFNVEHVAETFKLLGKNEENKRTLFLLVIYLTFVQATVSSGEQSTFFLFTQSAYQWTVVDYSYLTSTRTVANFLGLSILVPLFAKVFNFRDLTIILISYLDVIVINLIYILYQSPIGLYIGIALSILRAPGHAANRALLTKSVMEEDTAKAFSLIIVTIALANAAAAQIYNQGIYEHTRETFPQAFFLLGIVLHALNTPILIFLYFREKKNERTVEAADEENVEELNTHDNPIPNICETIDILESDKKIIIAKELDEATHI